MPAPLVRNHLHPEKEIKNIVIKYSYTTPMVQLATETLYMWLSCVRTYLLRNFLNVVGTT